MFTAPGRPRPRDLRWLWSALGERDFYFLDQGVNGNVTTENSATMSRIAGQGEQYILHISYASQSSTDTADKRETEAHSCARQVLSISALSCGIINRYTELRIECRNT